MEEKKQENIFEVIVSNIGIVYSGNNYMQAQCKYIAYVKQSKKNVGKAGGESVTLFQGASIRCEYYPPRKNK